MVGINNWEGAYLAQTCPEAKIRIKVFIWRDMQMGCKCACCGSNHHDVVELSIFQSLERERPLQTDGTSRWDLRAVPHPCLLCYVWRETMLSENLKLCFVEDKSLTSSGYGKDLRSESLFFWFIFHLIWPVCFCLTLKKLLWASWESACVLFTVLLNV